MKYAIIFRDFLKDLSSRKELGSIYHHLFSLKTDEELEYMLNDYFNVSQGKCEAYGDYGKTDWFALWHKSIRQCDFFDNCYQKRNERILTKDERKRMQELYAVFYDKTIPEDQREKNKLDRKTEFHKFHSLRRKESEETESIRIGGHLDMLLWNTIHMDKDNELYKIFKRVFLEMEITEKQPA